LNRYVASKVSTITWSTADDQRDLKPDRGAAHALDANYEPWLFQSMIDELATNELGISFIYSILERLASATN